jgi:hypothetical protein
MCRIVRLSCAGFALLMAVAASAGPANSVVYCTTVGVPKRLRCSTGCCGSGCRRAGCWSRHRLQDAGSPQRLRYAMTSCGTFETCQRTLRMSANRGRPEVAGGQSKRRE